MTASVRFFAGPTRCRRGNPSMFWLIRPRRRWWLVPVGVALLGGWLLWHPTKHPLVPVPAAGIKPRPAARPPVPGVVSSPLGSEEHMVALGDFNGDGHQDLAITDQD